MKTTTEKNTCHTIITTWHNNDLTQKKSYLIEDANETTGFNVPASLLFVIKYILTMLQNFMNLYQEKYEIYSVFWILMWNLTWNLTEYIQHWTCKSVAIGYVQFSLWNKRNRMNNDNNGM